MRIFVAGATGVLGVRLVRLLFQCGHEVAGMTRSPDKADMLRTLGAEPVVCDVFDRDALRDAVVSFAPDVVIHQLTDLPDDARRLHEHRDANDRIRREGTHNLLAAAQAAGTVRRFLAQSVAWQLPGAGGTATEELERAVLSGGGVVLRYGRLYGPGTYYEREAPEPPRIHVHDAALRTVSALENEAGPGVLVIAES